MNFRLKENEKQDFNVKSFPFKSFSFQTVVAWDVAPRRWPRADRCHAFAGTTAARPGTIFIGKQIYGIVIFMSLSKVFKFIVENGYVTEKVWESDSDSGWYGMLWTWMYAPIKDAIYAETVLSWPKLAQNVHNLALFRDHYIGRYSRNNME